MKLCPQVLSSGCENYYRPDEVKELLKRAGFREVRVHLIQQEQVIWARGYQPPEV